MFKTLRPALFLFCLAAALTGCSRDAELSGTLEPHPLPVLHQFTDVPDVYPESIAVDSSTGAIFVGSVKHGTIYTGKVNGPEMKVFSAAGADGRVMATGMAVRQGRLIVVGRQTGLIFVYDTGDGSLISRMDTAPGAAAIFLNDVTFAPDGSAYVTDSVRPVLFRVAPTADGSYQVREFLSFEGTAVNYISAAGAPGINVNGIVATPDGRYLIIGKRNENALYRIDLQTRQIAGVRMPEGTLETPDGLFLQDHTLYVVQNAPESVAVLAFSDDYSSAVKEKAIRHPTFRFPTSVAVHQGRLLVVSAQFDTAGSPAAVSGPRPPIVPFWVTEIPLESP